MIIKLGLIYMQQVALVVPVSEQESAYLSSVSSSKFIECNFDICWLRAATFSC